MKDEKKTLLKAIRLENCFKMYPTSAQAKKEVFDKFKAIWGESMANHFLGKYDNADSLIWALDSENFKQNNMKNHNYNFKKKEKINVIEEIFFFLHTWFFVKPDAFFKNLKDKF